MREALQSGLRTYCSMVVLDDLRCRLAAGIAGAVASVRRLVVSSAVVADELEIVDCTETKPHRSLLCQLVE